MTDTCFGDMIYRCWKSVPCPFAVVVTCYVYYFICLVFFFFFFFFKQKTAYEIGLGIPAEPLFRSAASWLLNALLRIFAMSIITPKRKVLRMSVQDCWRPPL